MVAPVTGNVDRRQAVVVAVLYRRPVAIEVWPGHQSRDPSFPPSHTSQRVVRSTRLWWRFRLMWLRLALDGCDEGAP